MGKEKVMVAARTAVNILRAEARAMAGIQPGRGRLAAVDFLSDKSVFPVGTTGEVIHRTLYPIAPVIGDLASGDICDHYKERKLELQAPATDENIDAFTPGEDAHWSQKVGVTYAAGQLLNHTTRAAILKYVRDNCSVDK